jgi:hypothetical protein
MNAQLKPSSGFESIFDHNVTHRELGELFFGSPEPKEEYAEGLGRDSLLVDIARLYLLRGDADTSARYVAMIGDASIRSEFATRGCCEAHS